jgi:acyl-CoA thioesterase FadM
LIRQKTIIFIAFQLTVLSLFMSCAGQFQPSGGPVDSIPPEIIASDPVPNSVHFDKNKIVLEFSEYVQQRSAQEAVFISPNLGKLEFDWSGKKLTIMFSEKPKGNTTYILTVGTDVRDSRNNNRMSATFSLAFSTGTAIDSASISGIVIDPKPEGIMIFAYKLDGIYAGTLNPGVVKPDNLSQTGKDGSFVMPNLAYGTYRIFAIRDEFRNLLYDLQIDQFGLYTKDITLSVDNQHYSNVLFKMTMQDTTPPFLLNALPTDKNNLLLRFSEPIDAGSVVSSKISIVDTLNVKLLEIKNVNLLYPNRDTLIVGTIDQNSLTYSLVVEGLTDTSGNLISFKHNKTFFAGMLTPDTLKPYISALNIKNDSKDVPCSKDFEINFSEPVNKKSFENGFSLIDTNKVKVHGIFKWFNDVRVNFFPDTELASLMTYTIKIVLDSVIDYSSNSIRDSVYQIRFQTIDLKKTSFIRGTVINESNETTTGIVKLMAKNITAIASSVTLSLARYGGFEFKDLLEGQYTLEAFIDTDNSGKYTFGSVFPYKYAEKFVIYPDTIKVRARWPVDGITIRVK